MQKSAQYWIDTLRLTRHVEGGAFREVYRSALKIPRQALPDSFSGERHCMTSIYFLLTHDQFSAFHRIRSDETWHFYEGDPLLIHEIRENGQLINHLLGRHPEKGESFQCTIMAGSWFGSQVTPGGSYALSGCTVAPGFEFADFELADRETLCRQYPGHEKLITALTRV